jgi:hypothetical protein
VDENLSSSLSTPRLRSSLQAGVESPIGADLVGIVENLPMLGEEMSVMWANNNLRFPQFSCVAWVPEERRDRNKPIQYVVTASPELERKLAELQERQKSQSERGQGELAA